jgi:hypothetical protein
VRLNEATTRISRNGVAQKEKLRRDPTARVYGRVDVWVKFGVDETKALKLTFFDLYLLFVCCKVAE